ARASFSSTPVSTPPSRGAIGRSRGGGVWLGENARTFPRSACGLGSPTQIGAPPNRALHLTAAASRLARGILCLQPPRQVSLVVRPRFAVQTEPLHPETPR